MTETDADINEWATRARLVTQDRLALAAAVGQQLNVELDPAVPDDNNPLEPRTLFIESITMNGGQPKRRRYRVELVEVTDG